MGTSSSSSGPGGGIPLDPPWLDFLANAIGSPLEPISNNSPQPEPPLQQQGQPEPNVEMAPPKRFGNARRNLDKYARGGGRDSLEKALGSYSQKGMGGARRLANRMRASTSVGAGLFNFLQGVRDSTNTEVRDWVNHLSAKNLSAYEVGDEIIKQVTTSGGSLEEESCRQSMAQAISDLLAIAPDIDLLNMTNDSIWTVLEFFIANEAFNRLILDIGQLFESSRYPPREAVSRMNDIREYLQSEISAQIQKLRITTPNPTEAEMRNLLQNAIKGTFEVFEEKI